MLEEEDTDLAKFNAQARRDAPGKRGTAGPPDNAGLPGRPEARQVLCNKLPKSDTCLFMLICGASLVVTAPLSGSSLQVVSL